MCVLEAGLFGKHPRDRPRGKPPRGKPPRCRLPRRRPRRRKPPRSTPLRCKPLRGLPPRGAAFRMYGTAPVPYVWNEPVFQMWATLSFWTAGFQDAAKCLRTLFQTHLRTRHSRSSQPSPSPCPRRSPPPSAALSPHVHRRLVQAMW